ncbi:MAG: O-antigen ligase family protein [Kiritimatiellae bacterium]|nr:O-antigen ligase family protein [Kiritimatiellia bacterium]MDD4341399.1 O-antigen ligase family protein [Kiritimatiellia bacterium]
MNLWAFRFILWYICILFVQPQNRFTFLWPLRIANLAFIIGVGLHIVSCLEGRRSLLRLGLGTILAIALMLFATLSQHVGIYQISPAWNPYLDILIKNALLLIMIAALATTVERVWAVQITMLIATLWWVKAGLRLSALGATYSGDRLMGAAVSMIENPNGFAYMMCVFLPLYLYAYQRATRPWVRWGFLACALAAVWIIFETGSRTGLVTLIVLGIFLLPHYGRHRWKTLVGVGIALVLLFPLTGEKNKERFRTIPQSIAAFLGGGDTERTGPMSQDEQSADERQAKNRDTWALIKTYPLFGVGVNPNASQYEDRFPMASGQVHCEILMAGRQMGVIGMGLYVGFVGLIFFGGNWVRQNAAHWPAVRDLGWTFQLQAVAIAVGGFFSPLPWHPPMMILAGSVSALMGILRAERDAKMIQMAGG